MDYLVSILCNVLIKKGVDKVYIDLLEDAIVYEVSQFLLNNSLYSLKGNQLVDNIILEYQLMLENIEIK